MSIGIYKITNNINNKVYIGQSWNIENRWKQHKKRSQKSYLSNALKKYGIESFSFEVIITIKDTPFTQKYLDKFEEIYIRKYNSLNEEYGYNIREAGSRGKLSEVSKKKLSLKAKGRVMPEEIKKKISLKNSGINNPFYGKEHSIETKNKMSLNHVDVCGSKNPSAKKIFCAETNEIFDYASLACEKYKLDLSSVIKCCKNKRKTVGGYHWKYYLED